MYQNELYHHGILGQKWGIRRYQNSDGSLTAAGRKRYAGLTGKIRKIKDTRQYNKTKKELAKARKARAAKAEQKKEWAKDPETLRKHMDAFTDKEIDEAIERFSRDQKLADIQNAKTIRVMNTIKTGAQTVTEVLKAVQGIEDVNIKRASAAQGFATAKKSEADAKKTEADMKKTQEETRKTSLENKAKEREMKDAEDKRRQEVKNNKKAEREKKKQEKEAKKAEKDKKTAEDTVEENKDTKVSDIKMNNTDLDKLSPSMQKYFTSTVDKLYSGGDKKAIQQANRNLSDSLHQINNKKESGSVSNVNLDDMSPAMQKYYVSSVDKIFKKR